MPKFKKGNISDPFYETQIENLKSKLKISEESNDVSRKIIKSSRPISIKFTKITCRR